MHFCAVDVHPNGEKTEKGTAAAHAENVDDVVAEPHDPDSEPEKDTNQDNPQDPNEQEERSHGTAQQCAKRRRSIRRKAGTVGCFLVREETINAS